MDVTRVVAKNIRMTRKAKGFSQEVLAERSHVSVRMLGNIERGTSNPSILVLCYICLALDVSLDQIAEFGHLREETMAKRAENELWIN